MIDKEDIIAEYEKQLQEKDNEIERLNNIIKNLINDLEHDIKTFSDKNLINYMEKQGLEHAYLKGSIETCESILARIKGVDKE